MQVRYLPMCYTKKARPGNPERAVIGAIMIFLGQKNPASKFASGVSFFVGRAACRAIMRQVSGSIDAGSGWSSGKFVGAGRAG